MPVHVRMLPDLVAHADVAAPNLERQTEAETYGALTWLALQTYRCEPAQLTSEQTLLLQDAAKAAEAAVHFCNASAVGLEVPLLVERLVERLMQHYQANQPNDEKQGGPESSQKADKSEPCLLEALLHEATQVLDNHKLPNSVPEEGVFVAKLKAGRDPGNKRTGTAAAKVVEMQQKLVAKSEIQTAKHEGLEALIMRTKVGQQLRKGKMKMNFKRLPPKTIFWQCCQSLAQVELM